MILEEEEGSESKLGSLKRNEVDATFDYVAGLASCTVKRKERSVSTL